VLEYFHPWPNDAGFYVAASEGLYRDAGLDVEIATYDPLRGDSLEYLSRGEADFAVAPTNRLLVRRDGGERLVGIAAVNQRALETFQTVTATGIARPRDLERRRLALNPTPRGLALARHLVAADGGDPARVVIVDSGVRELTVDDIAAGEADATFGGYWAWDALFGQLPEAERVVWRVDEIGAPPYFSYVLAAREEVVLKSPETLRAFLGATARGFALAAADHAAALSVLERVIPYFPRPLLARSLGLIAPTWTHEGRWGEQRREQIEPYAAWLARHRIIGSADTWNEAITNELLA
jgi:NitT/TauT family transport system substrate-binding protein